MKDRKIKIIFLVAFVVIIGVYFLLEGDSVQANKEINLQNTRYYKKENLNRYLEYQRLNKKLDVDTIVNYVNMNLDKKFYTDIKVVNENGYLTLVNKYLRLKDTYEPSDLVIPNELYNPYQLKLRKEASINFEKMGQAMQMENLSIILDSAYRSYNYQVFLYSKYKDADGIDKADTYSARPGHSEHQLGLVVDVKTKHKISDDFDQTKEYIWMLENAHKFGYILRYPKDKTNITGYQYEPWHYRYVGIKVATDMHNNYPDLTYEEYYYHVLKNN